MSNLTDALIAAKLVGGSGGSGGGSGTPFGFNCYIAKFGPVHPTPEEWDGVEYYNEILGGPIFSFDGVLGAQLGTLYIGISEETEGEGDSYYYPGDPDFVMLGHDSDDIVAVLYWRLATSFPSSSESAAAVGRALHHFYNANQTIGLFI